MTEQAKNAAEKIYELLAPADKYNHDLTVTPFTAIIDAEFAEVEKALRELVEAVAAYEALSPRTPIRVLGDAMTDIFVKAAAAKKLTEPK